MDKRFMGLDMSRLFRQKILIGELAESIRKEGYENLANELEASMAVFDAVQDEAEVKGCFTEPLVDETTGLFCNDDYNGVLDDIEKEDVKIAKELGYSIYRGRRHSAMDSVREMVSKGEYYDAACRYRYVKDCSMSEALDAIKQIKGEYYDAAYRYHHIKNCSMSEAFEAVKQMFIEAEDLNYVY